MSQLLSQPAHQLSPLQPQAHSFCPLGQDVMAPAEYEPAPASRLAALAPSAGTLPAQLGPSAVAGPDLAAQYSQLFSGLCDPPLGQHAAEPSVDSAETAHPESEAESESAPSGKTALRASKLASDIMRLPAALKAAGRNGNAKPSAFAGAWPRLERAGAAGETFLARHLPNNAGRWVEHTKNALGYALQDPKTILKHLGGEAQNILRNAAQPSAARWAGEKTAALAVERTAAKEAGALGGKLAGKELGKLVPGLNVGVSLGAAGLDLREMAHNVQQKNYVGATIEGLHAATDAAGVIPGVGTVVSLLGDALSIGAHWISGR
jgi:hypothetical protein